MVEHTAHYALSTEVDLPYEQAVELTREALNSEGFGVLTEIDVKATPPRRSSTSTSSCTYPRSL